MRLLTAITLIILTVVACGPDKKAVEAAKFEEVMGVHDEVMPKMSDIRKLKKSLEEKVAAMDTSSVTDEQESISQMIVELDEASESMMVWMRSFAEPEEGTAHEEVIKFYDAELEKITEVKNKMLQAIEKAEGMQ